MKLPKASIRKVLLVLAIVVVLTIIGIIVGNAIQDDAPVTPLSGQGPTDPNVDELPTD